MHAPGARQHVIARPLLTLGLGRQPTADAEYLQPWAGSKDKALSTAPRPGSFSELCFKRRHSLLPALAAHMATWQTRLSPPPPMQQIGHSPVAPKKISSASEGPEERVHQLTSWTQVARHSSTLMLQADPGHVLSVRRLMSNIITRVGGNADPTPSQILFIDAH